MSVTYFDKMLYSPTSRMNAVENDSMWNIFATTLLFSDVVFQTYKIFRLCNNTMSMRFKILLFLLILNWFGTGQMTLPEKLEHPRKTSYAKHLVWGAIKPTSLELEGKAANTKDIQKFERITGFGVIIDKNLILSSRGDAPGNPQMDAKILGVHVKGDVERVVGYGQTVFKDVPEKPYQVPLKTGALYKNPKNHIALYETTEKLKLDKQKAESVILASKEYKIGDKCVIIKPTGTQNGQEISEFDVEILDEKNCMQMVPDIDSDLLCFNISSCAVEAAGVPVICSGELASIITVEKPDCEKPLVGANIFKNRQWIHSKANELYVESSSSNVVSNSVTFAAALLILYGKLLLI
ncbi:uncharacterized protein ACN427_014497 [Glossina fuscipes fuscipes]